MSYFEYVLNITIFEMFSETSVRCMYYLVFICRYGLFEGVE